MPPSKISARLHFRKCGCRFSRSVVVAVVPAGQCRSAGQLRFIGGTQDRDDRDHSVTVGVVTTLSNVLPTSALASARARFLLLQHRVTPARWF
jgi:hypothetical protein